MEKVMNAHFKDRDIERLVHDAPEVAYMLHLGLSSVRAMIASGELRSFTIGDRRLVRREDLMKFIEERASAAA
jgi:excisionase family DNA binding protein